MSGGCRWASSRRSRRRLAVASVAGAALLGSAASARAQEPGVPDPFGLLRPQPYVAARASSNSPDPESNDDSLRPIPGETATIADLEGPGSVSHIWMTIADSEYGWPRLLRLRIYYDGSAVPSVDTPVGDFFAVGLGLERPVQSLMVRDGSQGRSRNSYWPMPFRRSCRITVTNEGRRRVANLYYHVDWQKLASLPADTPYFHARYRQALPASGGRPYEVLSVLGRGHFVGTVFSVVQAEAGWFGEGDDLFYVDGEKKASIEGTGTEDYFNDAWGLHVSEGAYTGVPVAEGTGLGARMSAYRWHLVDPVPFTRSLSFAIEHKGWTFNPDGSVKSAFGERTDLISSVAFWYQQGIAADQPELPYGPARLPQGNAQQIEVEKSLGEVRAEQGKASLSPDLFWSKDVLLFEAEGAGARVEIPFDVAQDGDYELYAELAQGADYGVYTALLDGQRPEAATLEHEPGADVRPQTSFDGFAPETYVGAAYAIGWPRLSKGRHTLTFVCLGKRPDSAGYVLGVDDLVLAGTGDAAWAAVGRSAPPRAPSGGVADLTRGLADPDPVVRGLAALALRARGREAQPALPALTAALRDPDANVRIASANAIGAIGPAAAPAVAALTAACSAKGEEVQVLRACAGALGAIGRAAAPSLPVLRELMALPRVRWAAQAAIREIE
jgi:hypothetical protein